MKIEYMYVSNLLVSGFS